MINPLKAITLLAILSCALMSSTAQTPTLTAEQTVTYINNQLASYPDRWSKRSCPSKPTFARVSISGDHRYILVDDTWHCNFSIHYEMDVLQLFSGPTQRSDGEISELDTGAFSTENGDQSEVRFMGHGGMTWNGKPAPAYSTYEDGHEVTWGPYVEIKLTAPGEIARRLGRAMSHLADVLKAEANSKVPQDDPFAKPNE